MGNDKTETAKRLPLPARALIPHRPPMLIVDKLLHRDPDRATGEAVLPTEGICFDRGRILPECFVELIAQTAAMGSGYDAMMAGGGELSGMLVGIDELTLHGRGRNGGAVRIETEKIFEFGTVRVVRGSVYQDKELLASGTLKVWEENKGRDE